MIRVTRRLGALGAAASLLFSTQVRAADDPLEDTLWFSGRGACLIFSISFANSWNSELELGYPKFSDSPQQDDLSVRYVLHGDNFTGESNAPRQDNEPLKTLRILGHFKDSDTLEVVHIYSIPSKSTPQRERCNFKKDKR